MAGPTPSAAEFAAAVTAVTSAFGDPTRREIYLFVRDSESGVTASAVAERFALHPNVARHHLDKLAAGGYLDVQVGRVEGHAGAGRPSKRYVASSRDLALTFPATNDSLLITLLGRLLEVVPPEQAEAVAASVGEDYGRALAHSMSPGDGHRSFRTALHAVADALTAHGFAAHTESSGSSLRIISEACPFGETAVAHPVICAVDRGLVQGMLSGLYGDTLPATESSRAMGDDVCVTSV
jgi:predicted ArsR family transcriptional regulator